MALRVDESARPFVHGQMIVYPMKGRRKGEGVRHLCDSLQGMVKPSRLQCSRQRMIFHYRLSSGVGSILGGSPEICSFCIYRYYVSSFCSRSARPTHTLKNLTGTRNPRAHEREPTRCSKLQRVHKTLFRENKSLTKEEVTTRRFVATVFSAQAWLSNGTKS